MQNRTLNIPQYRRHDLECFAKDDLNGRIELLVIEVIINKEKWLMFSIYKQHKVKNCYLVECLEAIMSHISQSNYNLIFLGDFHVNMAKKNDLTEFLDFNGLNNLVKEPTCFKGTPSVIDLIVTNKPKRFKVHFVLTLGSVISILWCARLQNS